MVRLAVAAQTRRRRDHDRTPVEVALWPRLPALDLDLDPSLTVALDLTVRVAGGGRRRVRSPTCRASTGRCWPTLGGGATEIPADRVAWWERVERDLPLGSRRARSGSVRAVRSGARAVSGVERWALRLSRVGLAVIAVVTKAGRPFGATLVASTV